MKEMLERTAPIELSPVMKKFIVHWGEMGARWGINRTVAQIHALLYLWPEPLNAEQVAATLSVARSNVSTGLRELQAWGIVRTSGVLGDRRDHFTSTKDVWDMFRVILDERKRREIDPTLEMLRECVEEFKKADDKDTEMKERLLNLLDFFETMTSLYTELRRMPTSTVREFAKLRGRIRNLLRGARGT